MHYKYPPDADAMDVFNLDEEGIDAILKEREKNGKEEAILLAEDLGLERKRAEDLLEWFSQSTARSALPPRDAYDDDDWGEIDFAEPGGRSALRAASKGNPRNLPCPNCGAKNRLTPRDRQLGYQCDECADRAEGRGG